MLRLSLKTGVIATEVKVFRASEEQDKVSEATKSSIKIRMLKRFFQK